MKENHHRGTIPSLFVILRYAHSYVRQLSLATVATIALVGVQLAAGEHLDMGRLAEHDEVVQELDGGGHLEV